jgi:hypothetical protein
LFYFAYWRRPLGMALGATAVLFGLLAFLWAVA